MRTHPQDVKVLPLAVNDGVGLVHGDKFHGRDRAVGKVCRPVVDLWAGRRKGERGGALRSGPSMQAGLGGGTCPQKFVPTVCRLFISTGGSLSKRLGMIFFFDIIVLSW